MTRRLTERLSGSLHVPSSKGWRAKPKRKEFSTQREYDHYLKLLASATTENTALNDYVTSIDARVTQTELDPNNVPSITNRLDALEAEQTIQNADIAALLAIASALQDDRTEILHQSGIPVTHSGDADLTTLRSFTVPANTLDTGDSIRIWGHWSISAVPSVVWRTVIAGDSGAGSQTFFDSDSSQPIPPVLAESIRAAQYLITRSGNAFLAAGDYVAFDKKLVPINLDTEVGSIDWTQDVQIDFAGALGLADAILGLTLTLESSLVVLYRET